MGMTTKCGTACQLTKDVQGMHRSKQDEHGIRLWPRAASSMDGMTWGGVWIDAFGICFNSESDRFSWAAKAQLFSTSTFN